MLCDRALTLSFTKQHAVVQKPIFLAAAEQILGEDVVSQRVQSQRKWYLASAFILAIIFGYGLGSLYVNIVAIENLTPGMVIVQITTKWAS